MMNKVPVILISGFLGSGKTTLLLRLLAHTRQIPLRAVVLMNEMGEYNVDSAIISEEMPDVTVEGLLEGCICCSKRNELAGALHTLLSQEPDLIFMETTGVANPEQVLEELRSPLLADQLYLVHSISVVDAELFHEYNSRFTADKELVRTLHGQLRTADFIVVNKTDAASSREVTKVVKSIRKLNDTAKLQTTEYSRVDLEPLLEPVLASTSVAEKPVQTPQPAPEQVQPTDAGALSVATPTKIIGQPSITSISTPFKVISAHSHSHSHDPNQTHSFSHLESLTLHQYSPQPLEKQRLERFLTGLGSSLLRAKGYCVLPQEGTMLLQFAGNHLEWLPTALPVSQGYVTLIGKQLDKASITDQWEQCFISL
ncbi:GTP-binding protein [Paenibacillus polymyxa]|uniref:CobW family GTP-binding protein n=1 Tax=Paenibacillus polymyxa TaxID=1406 RepID=UPI0004D9392B|nr:CobW family GTP-binding protein [Paenibacillus polymyxa]KEO77338.1 GTPase [Paenibacillus polymyxa]MCH6189377.1 GTP-binding protein [Paenibacillus polymyxa]WRL59801.1 CobW family GTP-binding protein [Paenibacillus polymyxa]